MRRDRWLEQQARRRARIAKMYADGMGMGNIAKRLGISIQRVSIILKTERAREAANGSASSDDRSVPEPPDLG